MRAFPALNFPAYTFRTAQRAGVLSVWDELRGRWLVLTPEEWVRRHAIRFLENEMGVKKLYIAQEVPVLLHGQPQRADAVVYAPAGRVEDVTSAGNVPLLLVECKAPEVAIDGACLAQAVRYNSVLGARYLFLTNGLRHYFYERDAAGEYRPLKEIPDLKGYFL